jgi:protein-L-isoaspartate(D-aspartate) O-methyltransferase
VKRGDYPVAREKMVREQLAANGIANRRVLDVMRKVPRHLFFDGDMGSEAYSDHAFPIGFAQTMSQPFMVGYLAQELVLEGEETVLEIGTGSGYQAAVLGGLCRGVYTIERIEPLARKAREALSVLGIANVEVSVGDGSLGLPEHAPFDRILATAAAGEVPASLLGQLRDGGFFLGPVFNAAGEQEIVRLTRCREEFRVERLRKCAFVPLIRGDFRGAKSAKDSD